MTIGALAGLATALVESAWLENQFGYVLLFRNHIGPFAFVWVAAFCFGLPVAFAALLLRIQPGEARVDWPPRNTIWAIANGVSQLAFGPMFWLSARVLWSPMDRLRDAGSGLLSIFWLLLAAVAVMHAVGIAGLIRRRERPWFFPTVTALVTWQIAHLTFLDALVLVQLPRFEEAARNAPRGIPGAAALAAILALAIATMLTGRRLSGRRQDLEPVDRQA